MAAQPVQKLPESEEWMYELKLHGCRALLIKNGQQIQLRSRNDKDLKPMYPGIAAATLAVAADSAVIDGEGVVLDENGAPSFQALRHRGAQPKHMVVFYAFEVLHTVWPGPHWRAAARKTAELPKAAARAGAAYPAQGASLMPSAGTVSGTGRTTEQGCCRNYVGRRVDGAGCPPRRDLHQGFLAIVIGSDKPVLPVRDCLRRQLDPMLLPSGFLDTVYPNITYTTALHLTCDRIRWRTRCLTAQNL